MMVKNPNIQVMNEIEEFAMTQKKIAEIIGLTFDVTGFIKKIERTRLTTHMDLRQAFEHERNELY